MKYFRFVPNKPLKGADFNSNTYEGTVVFVVSSFQYITLAVNYSNGPPYRKRIWTNSKLETALMINCISTGRLFSLRRANNFDTDHCM